MITRNTARVFGVNITNRMEVQLEDKKRNKIKRSKSINCDQLIKNHPEISPYIEQITSSTLNQEHQSYIVDNFMIKHSQINTKMREELNGWLFHIIPKLSLSSHTLYLTIFIIDKYCCNNYISQSKYQLLGIAAMFIAAKYQEVKTPKLKNYHSICQEVFTMDQILLMESQILITLNFKIKSITSCWHLQEYIQYAEIKDENKRFSQYLLDLSLIQYHFCLIKPSIISWSIIIFISKLRNLRQISIKEISCIYRLCKYQLQESISMVNQLFQNRKNEKFRSVNQRYQFQIGQLIF